MSKIKDKIGSVVQRLRAVKHIEIFIAIGAILIMLLVYFTNSCGNNENSGISTDEGEYDYCTRVVEELESKLSEIEDVGEVSVLISWTSTADSTENAYPKPEGVIIICDGGDNISVKVRLISSVASYFGIAENKINVLTKSNKNK